MFTNKVFSATSNIHVVYFQTKLFEVKQWKLEYICNFYRKDLSISCTMLKSIPSTYIPEVGYPTSRQKVSCTSFLFYLEISAMSPVQVRNNVESCSYSQEKFKLVKWSLLVTLETQTPYFEKSFKVEEDCECHLQGQICNNGMTINWHVEEHWI